jgi:hypothetical protein
LVNNKFGLDLDYFIDLVYFEVHDCSPRATITSTKYSESEKCELKNMRL